MRRAVRRVAVLKRRQAAAMKGDIRVNRTRLERLANEQARLAMRIAADADEFNVRRQREIARHLLPDKTEGVVGEPHVFATAGNEIAALGRIKIHQSGPGDITDVALVRKNSEFG